MPDAHPHPSPPNAQLDAQPLRFLHAYWNVWRALTVRAEDALTRRHDLDLRTFIALSYIQGGVTSPGELARIMTVPKYEVTRSLNRLSRLNAIHRTVDPGNARRQSLHATEPGRALWAAALSTVETVTASPLASLGPNLDPLTLSLEHLAQAAQEKP